MRTSLRVWLFVLSLSFTALIAAAFLPNRHLSLAAWVVVLGINVFIFWFPEWIIARLKATELLGNDSYGVLQAWKQLAHPQTHLRFWQVEVEADVLMVLGRSSRNAHVLISEKILKSLSQDEISLLVKALARWAHSPTLFPLTILTGLAVYLPKPLNRWMHKRLIEPSELLLLEKNLFTSTNERNAWAHLLLRWNHPSRHTPKNLMLSKACSSLLPFHSENMECRIINLTSQFPPQR